MSAGRVDRNRASGNEPPKAAVTELSLSPKAVTFRRNGIEFLTAKPVTAWTEMTVAIESPLEGRKVTCRGVVVACQGNRHKGYTVSLLFLGLTPQIQERLESLALSYLG